MQGLGHGPDSHITIDYRDPGHQMVVFETDDNRLRLYTVPRPDQMSVHVPHRNAAVCAPFARIVRQPYKRVQHLRLRLTVFRHGYSVPTVPVGYIEGVLFVRNEGTSLHFRFTSF